MLPLPGVSCLRQLQSHPRNPPFCTCPVLVCLGLLLQGVPATQTAVLAADCAATPTGTRHSCCHHAACAVWPVLFNAEAGCTYAEEHKAGLCGHDVGSWWVSGGQGVCVLCRTLLLLQPLPANPDHDTDCNKLQTTTVCVLCTRLVAKDAHQPTHLRVWVAPRQLFKDLVDAGVDDAVHQHLARVPKRPCGLLWEGGRAHSHTGWLLSEAQRTQTDDSPLSCCRVGACACLAHVLLLVIQVCGVYKQLVHVVVHLRLGS